VIVIIFLKKGLEMSGFNAFFISWLKDLNCLWLTY